MIVTTCCRSLRPNNMSRYQPAEHDRSAQEVASANARFQRLGLIPMGTRRASLSSGRRPQPAVLHRSSPASSAYQTPLSLPVIFWPTAAAVARHGNKLSRTLFLSSRLSSKVVSWEA
jgi:hypothetical protein